MLKIGTAYDDLCLGELHDAILYIQEKGKAIKSFTGLCYDVYFNTKEIGTYGYYLDGLEHGLDVQLDKKRGIKSCREMKQGRLWGASIEWHDYAKDSIAKIEYSKFGINIYKKIYDDEGNLVEEYNAKQSDLDYVKKKDESYRLDELGRLILAGKAKDELVDGYVEQISCNTFKNARHGIGHVSAAALGEEFLIAIQKGLKNKITAENKVRTIKTVAGVDLSYFEMDDKEYAICVVAIIDYETGELINSVCSPIRRIGKYTPDCVAFRDIPLFLKANEKLIAENIQPDIYMFDGNGILHPRKMGVATHAGIVLNKSTFGVTKNYFKVANTDFIVPENQDNAYTDIVIDDEVYGVAFRSYKDVNPIFISTGNAIDLDTAITVTKHYITKESQIPSPTRYANIISNDLRKRIIEKKISINAFE